MSDLKSTPRWSNSVSELRDSYQAFRQVIAEHSDRANLVRRYEEVFAELQSHRKAGQSTPRRSFKALERPGGGLMSKKKRS